jgi:hypothetical protein
MNMRYLMLCLLFAGSASFGAESEDKFRECWQTAFSGHLTEYRSRAIAIALPAGSRGPIEDFDTPDYGWEGEEGSFRVKFGDFSAVVEADEVDQLEVRGTPVSVYRWKDYGGVDRIIGQWRLPSRSIGAFAISVPVGGNGCLSISRAKAILESVRYINDVDLIKVGIEFHGGTKTVIVSNEIGDIRRLKIGDSITSENQVITSIGDGEIMIGSYDFGSHKWTERRISATASHEK